MIRIKKIYIVLIISLIFLVTYCLKESTHKKIQWDNTLISQIENDYEVDKIVSDVVFWGSKLQNIIECYMESFAENIKKTKESNIFDSFFCFYEDIEFPDKIGLEYELMQSNEKAELYKVKINFNEEFEKREYNGHDRLILGYFYIEDNVVYFLDELDRSAEVTIDSILLEGKIIFADQEYYKSLNIEVKENDYLEFVGDICIHHYYAPNDEKGYYRTVGWDEEKGLIIFRNGFGCEMEAITLYRQGADIERYE